eukprot:COSAG04_NODE_175_length_21521_cov_167.404071_22_plen_75_part_00
MDVANYIHVASKSQVKLTIETHYVGDVRLTAQVGAVLEGYQLKSLNGLLERKFEKMEVRFNSILIRFNSILIRF